MSLGARIVPLPLTEEAQGKVDRLPKWSTFRVGVYWVMVVLAATVSLYSAMACSQFVLRENTEA